MIEIRGRYNTAVCYTEEIEEAAAAQIRGICDCPMSEGSRIRIMPDVHAGKGCTIGTTMTVLDRAVPNVVGVDIGCGMYTVRLLEERIDFQKLDEAAHFIPSGFDVWKDPQEPFDLTVLRCFGSLKDRGRLERSLGTLGGGNHFIEAEEAPDGTKYLVIHSGSRNLGKQVAELYQQKAVDLAKGKEEYLAAREALIRDCRAAGRETEIQEALDRMKAAYDGKETEVPEALCCLYGADFEDYLHDVAVCQRFAWRNREIMAGILMERAGLTGLEAFHTVHNYIDTEERILRKGAIAAHKGEKVLIPVNMRDGSILACGKGNPEWNYSAPHGAGRIMSRKKAMESLSLDAYRDAMRGIYTTSVSRETLDEAPMAYKPMNVILDAVRDSVDVIGILKPVYNFKASGAA